MDRLHFQNHSNPTPEGRPDMTVLEAADAMERTHGSQLLIRNADRVIGLLTEQDIVQKVLAAGRRPDTVRVADIMRMGHETRDGTQLLLEDDDKSPEEDSSDLYQVLSGKCEECGLFSLDLLEYEGMLSCPDCRVPTRLLYA